MRIAKTLSITYATLLIIVITSSSFAASPLGNVGTAKVDAGKASAGIRVGYTEDNESASSDNRWRLRQHVDHGFNDWYAVRLVAAQDKRDGDNLEHASFTFENRIQLIEKRDHGWDGGIRLIYNHADGDKTPHRLDFRLMAMGDICNSWSWRHNSIFRHDVGENSRHGASLEWRHQVVRNFIVQDDIVKKVSLGAEMFNDFGKLRDLSGYSEQDHQFGPVLKLGFHNGAYLQTGYRHGISHGGTDHLFKLFVGMNF